MFALMMWHNFSHTCTQQAKEWNSSNWTNQIVLYITPKFACVRCRTDYLVPPSALCFWRRWQSISSYFQKTYKKVNNRNLNRLESITSTWNTHININIKCTHVDVYHELKFARVCVSPRAQHCEKKALAQNRGHNTPMLRKMNDSIDCPACVPAPHCIA